MILEALNTRACYFNELANHEGADVIEYNTKHREGSGIEIDNELDILAYACRTGEVFHGRPQERPNVEFGSTSRAENSASCRKTYTKGKSHTPGIFTVQCVCSRPKLLEFSVTLRTEGVSTPLSTLLSRFKIYVQFK